MNMRKFILLFISLCSFATYTYAQSTAAETDETGKVLAIGKKEFLEKVYDYEKNPHTWTYKGQKPALIDFYADWCGPCRMLSPVLKKLAAQYEDEIVVYKINTDKEQELAAAFGIRSLPTLLFVPVGEMPQVAQGALPEKVLEKGINEVLLKREYKEEQ